MRQLPKAQRSSLVVTITLRSNTLTDIPTSLSILAVILFDVMVPYMLLLNTIQIRYYSSHEGHSPFEKWFAALNAIAAAKITKAIYKLELGNFSNVEGVGQGVFEQKIDFGPGYRVYFGKDSSQLIILLLGGSKKRQSNDIAHAISLWQDYKKRKR